MLKVRITNRMSHEDYIAASTEYPYVLSRRHLLGICSVFVVCMVMVLPTPELWLDNDSQKQVLTQAGRDYLAADESETEKALAATEHELIPHQENYDDYDIPLDQFASTTDEPNLTGDSSTQEQDDIFDQMATSDYEGVTDSAIANNGEWDWESLSNANKGTPHREDSSTQNATQTDNTLLADTNTSSENKATQEAPDSTLAQKQGGLLSSGALGNDTAGSLTKGSKADGSTLANASSTGHTSTATSQNQSNTQASDQVGPQSTGTESTLDGKSQSLAAHTSSEKGSEITQDLISGHGTTGSDASNTPVKDSTQQLAQNSNLTANESNADNTAHIASNGSDKSPSTGVLENASKGTLKADSSSTSSAQNQQLVAQNTASSKGNNQGKLSSTNGVAKDTAGESSQLAQNQHTSGTSSEIGNKSEGDKLNTGSKSQAKIKDQNTTQDTKLAQAERPSGTWYRYTIESGDNFSAIFKSLSLPYATLNRITKVAKRKDLYLDVGEPVYFLVDKDNILKELVNPLDDEQQVRFTRMTGEEDFKVVYEAVNAHINQDEKLLSAMPDAFEMPSAIKAQEARRQRLLAQEKAAAERKAYEKANNINPKRPRLLIGEIKRGENFARAARREGLTPTEIKTMTNLFKNKINVNKLRSGDKFRVLFTGIGTQAGICAISIRSSSGNFEIFMNPKDRNFYGENEYTPTAGIFRRFPLAGEIKVNSPFNPKRRHPVTHRISPHNGVDFKANVGTPVYAPADGVVTFSGYQRAAGYYIIVRHANNYSTVYMHLSKSEVKKGEKIIVGQVIARSGNTGRTTGPHLHYEIRINDQPVNPLKVELPSSSHPNLAREQREAFANNVKILRADLQNDRLAAATQP